MNFKTTLTATIIAFSAGTIPVVANTNFNTGDVLGTDEAQITQNLETVGAVIDEIELEDGILEVEFMLEGKEWEAYVDPQSGQITEIAMEDSDDENDDDEDDEDDEDEDDEDESDDDDEAKK